MRICPRLSTIRLLEYNSPKSPLPAALWSGGERSTTERYGREMNLELESVTRMLDIRGGQLGLTIAVFL